MADAVARQHYTGDVKPVELKQRIQEAPVAHPERVEAKNEAGEATVTWVDGDSGHGGADFVDDGVPVTTVGKLTKQEWIKHHSVKTKP